MLGVQTVSWLGFGITIVFIALDFYFAFDKVPGNTWSEIMRSWAKETPFFPWAWAVLAGHFFHWGLEPVIDSPGNYALLIWITWVVVVTGMALKKAGYAVRTWMPLLPGFFVGALLWPVS